MPNYLLALPHFLAFFGLALLLLSVFWSLYTFLTPYDELGLIRAGNVSAAVALTGSLLGFALPLAASLLRSATPMVLVQWALLAALVQLAVYSVMALLMPNLGESVTQDRAAPAILLGGVSVVCGLLNAAAISF
jgi:putative membrane protein